MKVIKSENLIVFDVDETLVCYPGKKDGVKFPSDNILVYDPYDGEYVARSAHKPHIKLLKNHKARGATILVWSQNGYEWAKAVVRALELDEFVDIIASKPRAYVDDLPSSEWMGPRIYMKPEDPFGG